MSDTPGQGQPGYGQQGPQEPQGGQGGQGQQFPTQGQQFPAGPGYSGQPAGPGYSGQPAGPGYTGQPAGPGYTGQPAGPGYTGQPAGPGYTGQPAGYGYSGPPAGYGEGIPPGMPAHGYPAPGGQKPDNYLVWSILATLLCCLPLGAVGIYFSTQVDKNWFAGNFAGATDASNKAKLFSIISAAIGVVSIVIWMFGMVIMGVMDSS